MLVTTQNRAEGGNAWRRLGKIRLGITERGRLKCDQRHEHGEGCYVTYPKDVDYFVIPKEWQAKLGEKPKELAIILANPTLAQNFDTRAAMYTANHARICHTSDDKTAHRYKKPEGEDKFRWVTMPCPNLECDYRKIKPAKCAERGYFNFMVPAAGEIGTFLIVMGSKVAMAQIYTALMTVAGLCANRPGGMFGIRMKLRREPREFFQDLNGSGQLSKIVKYIPQVEIDWSSLLANDQVLLGPMMGQQALLPDSPVVLDPQDADDALEGGDA